MVNLNDGFNLHVLNKVDGRKVAEIRRATNDHDGTISILRFRKLSDVPNIILDFQMTEEDSFILQFEHTKAEEIMDLYTKFCDLLDDYIMADPATSQDIIEFFTTLKDLYNDEKPKLNAPKDNMLDPAETKFINSNTDPAPFDLTQEELDEMVERFADMNLEEDTDMTDDQRFTADFFDFCQEDKLNFFRLLQMVPYLKLIEDATPEELTRFNYLAFISLSFTYDEHRGDPDNLSPSVQLFEDMYRYSKEVIGEAIGDYSIVQCIQSVMETLEGYKARKWTKNDVIHMEGLLEGMADSAAAEKIEMVFDHKEIKDRDAFAFYIANNKLSHMISELFGMYSGTLYVKDVIVFNDSEYKEDNTAKGFLKFLNELPNLTNSKLKKNENSN